MPEWSLASRALYWISCPVNAAEALRTILEARPFDVEKVRPVPRALKVAKRVYSAEEYEMLVKLPEEELERAFLSIWVKREGTAKARGDSVWRGLASWKNGEIENSSARHDWRVEYLDLGPEFVGVVVAKGDDWRVEMRGEPAWG